MDTVPLTAPSRAAVANRAARPRAQNFLKPCVFALCLLPLAWLIWRGVNQDLGANPIEAVIRYLGDWALRFLLIALAVTPVRLVTGWTAVARLRRMLGLFAFTYVILHLLAYTGLDQAFDLHAIGKDIAKRTYITVGMFAFALLTPLAVTSTDRMVRRLGGLKWRRLHRVVYVAGIAGVIHYFMMIKAGYRLPLIYAVILATLLAVRVGNSWLRKIRPPAPHR